MLEEAEPRDDADAVIDGSASGVATTAARALAIGAALTSPRALHGLDRELSMIGLERLPSTWGGWDERRSLLAYSDSILADVGLAGEVNELETEGGAPQAATDAAPRRAERVVLWQRTAETGDAPAAVAWLRSVMTDVEPVAAAAAAAALSHWQRRKGIEVPTTLERADQLTSFFARSGVDEAQQIAQASRGIAGSGGTEPALDGKGEEPKSEETDEEETGVSLLVHGTRAYKGTWWFPGGDFHQFVRSNIRPDLYSGGAPFSWSGLYRRRDRDIAAERLALWGNDASPRGLNAVFGHSYGGVIVLNASAHGLRMKDVVLLSVPVEDVPIEWRNIRRVTSLRIHLDLVLLAARRRQYFTENVEEHHLDQWFFHHGDSHEPGIWTRRGCKDVLGL